MNIPEGRYVIVYYKNGKPMYLADDRYTSRLWVDNIDYAKRYIDLSAAEIRAGNLRYCMHPVNARVKYVNRDNSLFDVRRNTCRCGKCRSNDISIKRNKSNERR